MAVKQAFTSFTEKMNEDPSGIKGLNTTYQFNLKGDTEGSYQVKIEDSQVFFHEGTEFIPTCTLSMSDKNFLKLFQGDLNPTSAFMTGRLKVKGDLSLAMKLQSLLDKYK